MAFLVTFLLIVLVLVVIYFIFRWLKFNRSLKQEQSFQEYPEPTPKLPWWLFPFSDPLASKRIKQLHSHHNQKVQDQQLAEVFKKFSSEPKTTIITPAITPTNFHRLKALVHSHEKRHQKQPGFQNLDHLVEKLKRWEENKPLSNKEKYEIIQKLREIAKKS